MAQVSGGRTRGAAAIVAAFAWTGIALLLAREAAARGGDWTAALWWNARFFTDLSNLLIAVVFTALALRPRGIAARWYGMPLAAATMASTVYYGLLGGVHALGANGAGDVIAHGVVPAMVLLHWLLTTRGGKFAWRDVAVWAAFPLIYVGYALARGLAEVRYPYFFLDIGRLGSAVALYVLAILVLFVALSSAIVAVDRRLPRTR